MENLLFSPFQKEVLVCRLAVANAVTSPNVWGKTLLIGGGKNCQLYYQDFIEKLMKTIGIKPLPEEAFAKGPSSPLDWVDSDESERLLNYQRYSFESFLNELPKSMGFLRHLVWILSPLIRKTMLSQSPYLKQ